MKWYAIIPNEVLSNKELSSSAKLLIGVLVSLSNKSGYCFASNHYISEVLGMSTAYVRSLIKELENKNIITRESSLKSSGDLGSRMIKLVDLKLLKEDSEVEGGATIASGGVIAGKQGGATIASPYNKDNNKENIKVINNDRFEEFWEMYGKKIGKDKAKAKWGRLKESERDAILISIPKYKESRPDPTYRKDPERYIGHRVWEDEIPNSISTTPQPNNNKNTSFEIQIPEKW
jgi:DNA-binding Lrp family transcriptional regulator